MPSVSMITFYYNDMDGRGMGLVNFGKSLIGARNVAFCPYDNISVAIMTKINLDSSHRNHTLPKKKI